MGRVENLPWPAPGRKPREGQAVLVPSPELEQAVQVEALHQLGDPALSELGLEEFLDELLVRVREALSVDTVAILLIDRETQELVARAAKGIEEEVEEGVRIPIGKGFAGRIAAERVAIYIADVDHADILNPILREKGIRSLLGVPLIVEGDLIGVLHVGSLVPREFGPSDLAVLQVAAGRAAPGIERARLFSALEHEHQVAMILQRSLLPKRLAQTFGVTTAARYLPASDEVGGDWYDLFELPHGQLGIVIGDVVGHGVGAAALVGPLRTALPAYALEDYGPGRTLELVDRYVQAMPDYAMATAIYAVFQPDTGEVRLASAGHLPPLIVAGSEARTLELTPAVPLGTFPYGHCPESTIRLDPGDILALYTDGLVERAGVPLNVSIDQLLARVRHIQTPEELCRRAVDDQLFVDRRRDDVALVAVQNMPIADQLDLRVPAEARRLAGTRVAVRRWLRHVGAGEREVVELTMAVSEACTNAIEHAYSPAPAGFRLQGRAEEDELVLTVTDTGRWREPRQSDRGRGLTIIRAAVDDLDIDTGDQGTRVTMRRRLQA